MGLAGVNQVVGAQHQEGLQLAGYLDPQPLRSACFEMSFVELDPIGTNWKGAAALRRSFVGPLQKGLLNMESTRFKSWLEAYGRAWTERNAQAAADLFAEDGTYQITPFVEPVRGRSAIFDYWSQVAETERDIQFGYEILAATREAGIARWWASFLIIPQQLQTKLDGIFLIAFDGDGRCKSLREWWHKDQK